MIHLLAAHNLDVAGEKKVALLMTIIIVANGDTMAYKFTRLAASIRQRDSSLSLLLLLLIVLLQIGARSRFSWTPIGTSLLSRRRRLLLDL